MAGNISCHSKLISNLRLFKPESTFEDLRIAITTKITNDLFPKAANELPPCVLSWELAAVPHFVYGGKCRESGCNRAFRQRKRAQVLPAPRSRKHAVS